MDQPCTTLTMEKNRQRWFPLLTEILLMFKMTPVKRWKPDEKTWKGNLNAKSSLVILFDDLSLPIDLDMRWHGSFQLILIFLDPSRRFLSIAGNFRRQSARSRLALSKSTRNARETRQRSDSYVMANGPTRLNARAANWRLRWKRAIDMTYLKWKHAQPVLVSMRRVVDCWQPKEWFSEVNNLRNLDFLVWKNSYRLTL